MRTILFLLFLALACCRKEPLKPIELTTTPEPKLKIVWRVPAVPDTTEYPSNPYALCNGNIAFGTDFYSPSAFLQMRSAMDGRLQWKFAPTFSSTDGFSHGKIFSVGSKVMLSDWHEAYCIDGEEGYLQWGTNFRPQKADPSAAVINDQFYKLIYWGSPPKIHTYTLLRTHYLSGQWDTLLTIHQRFSVWKSKI